jgi:AcrR family transcriptional regulator
MKRIAQPGGSGASLRELAAAADVGLPTVRHYFGDRDGLVAAAFEEMRADGEPWLQLSRTQALDGGLERSLRWVLSTIAFGWPHGLGLVFSQGLAAGFDQPTLGPACVTEVLEPTLAAVEDRLRAHQGRGELRDDIDLRHAALALVSPVLLGLLHQHSLGGKGCRPLDVDAFVADHVAKFVRAWGR